ncbi:hypothetical protein D5086_006419 [Populus alba]|uniref:Uncharacterized protein n=1 Tax=Populus alba TaxID=43335 RepID=A0ACC4CLA7_POPAL
MSFMMLLLLLVNPRAVVFSAPPDMANHVSSDRLDLSKPKSIRTDVMVLSPVEENKIAGQGARPLGMVWCCSGGGEGGSRKDSMASLDSRTKRAVIQYIFLEEV